MTTTPVALPQAPFGRHRFAVIAVSVAALFGATRGSTTPAPLVILAGVLALGYLPGLALALWVENRRGFWGSWMLPLVLSPVVATFVGGILIQSGFRLEAAVGAIVFLSVIAVLFAPPPAREIEDWAVSLDRPGTSSLPDRHQVLRLALVVILLVGVPLLGRAWVTRSGASIHEAAVVGEIERGGLPPTDPRLAGAPLVVAWAFETHVALIRAATGLGVEGILAGGSLLAVLGIVCTGYRLLALLAMSHVQALWGVIVLVGGQNAAFWIWNPMRAWMGAGTGSPTWARNPCPPDASPAAALGLPASTSFFLERFLPAGPGVLGCLYLLLFLASAFASQEGERRRAGGMAMAAAVGVLLFHPELAVGAFFVTLLAVPGTWLVRRLDPFRGPGGELTRVLLPVVLALLVTAPYLATLRPLEWFRNAPLLGVDRDSVLTLLGALFPALLLGVPALVQFLRAADPRSAAWGVWTALGLAAALVLAFPGPRGPEVPFWLAYPPLALSAGTWVPGLWRSAGPRRRALLALGVGLVLVPNTVLGLMSYVRAPDPWDRDPTRRSAMEWLRDEGPARAIVVDREPDLALASGHRLLYDEAVRSARPGVDLDTRRRAYFALRAGEPLGPAERAQLLSFGLPILVVHRDEPQPTAECDVLHEEGTIRICGWTPSLNIPDAP